MCNRMCIRNAVHADVCTRENVSSFSVRFTRLSIHSMDFDFGFARRFFLTSCFWVKWCQCRAPSSIHIHRRDTHTQRVDTSCLCNCNSPSCGGGDGGASQFAKSLFVLFGALSFIYRRSRRRNKCLTVSFNSRTYQSVVISVCGASSSLWLEKSLRLCDGCRLVACTPFLLSSPSTGSISIPSKNELNAKMPSHLHKYISFKWYRQMNFRIERHPIIRNMEDEQNKMRNAKRVGRRRPRYLYNCCESKYK